MTKLGTLEVLRRYPVKSMRGEDLDRAFVAYTGVMGDRVWAFVDPEKAAKKDNFPWHSAREQHDLLLYTPKFTGELVPEVHYPEAGAFGVRVTTPAGKTLKIDDPALLADIRAKAGNATQLRFSEKGMQDSRPVSIFALDTAQALAAETGRAIDPLRFRANFYVRWDNGEPFYEDSLVGARLKVGDTLEVQIVKKDPRCVIICLEPATAELHPEVLRTVARKHGGCAGVYAAVLREGTVRKGDQITRLD